VLLVDDEAVVCRSVARIIERLGYIVTVAGSGEAALKAAATTQFDVVMTDHRMPGMSGPELIERLIALRPELRDRIILTGGDLESPETHAVLSRYRAKTLQKPFHLHDLGQALRGVTGLPYTPPLGLVPV
jgi:CheY-like chemotaxis protein